MLALNLKLVLFLLISILFVRPVFAQEYYFSDEFNTQRPPNQLDSNKWVVYPNKRTTPNIVGCMFDTIREEKGVALLHQCDLTDQYPYAVSKTNPIPNSDFVASVRFHFTGIGALPSGIRFVDKAPGNGEGQKELFSIGFEQSSNGNEDFRIEYKDALVYANDLNSVYRIFDLHKEGDIYKIYLNNQLVFTSPPTKERIGAMYLGNPSILPRSSWSDLRIDYIRVKKTGPTETTAPEPFLDLPWDYSQTGKSLDQLVYDPNSWFDHKYPLQNYSSDILGVLKFTGKFEEDFYKSHSGYDYGLRHGVGKDTPVLAAASGTASFVSEANSGGAGNMIKIDHSNGYQTWYEHLEEVKPGHQLIVSEEGKFETVTKGQKIGRVGLTGRTTGYHIHLSVFKDVNENGDFSDDYPFGLVDPLGWEGDYPDPWEEYSVNGKNGAKSHKLFLGLSTPKTQTITPTGGEVVNEEAKIIIPASAVNIDTTFKIDFGPFEKASDLIKSISPSLFLNAFNNIGETVTNFNNPLGLVYNYSQADLNNINEDTLSFYFFNKNSGIWEKISSTLDKNSKTISSTTNHFSQFAVMGELKDYLPPTTEAKIEGNKGNNNWYKSDVVVTLIAQDNPGGKGISYTVFSYDNQNWKEYKEPIKFDSEGTHKLWFLSHDNAGFEEDKKYIEFSIDKTIPEAKIYTNPLSGQVEITPEPENSGILSKKTLKDNQVIFTIEDQAGNTLILDTTLKEKDRKSDLEIKSLKYNQDQINQKPNSFSSHGIFKPKPKSEGELIRINQTFEIKDQGKFIIFADIAKNKTDLHFIDGKNTKKEEFDSIKLLWLKTNKGALGVSY